MRLHRFYSENVLPAEGEIFRVENFELCHQWRKVFRYNVGSQVIMFDGNGFEALCQIEDFDHAVASLRVGQKRPNRNRPSREVHIFQSLIKKDNLEWFFQKGTELGVSHFHPFISDRSQKKSFNIERASKIVREASEQSGRAVPPNISEVLTMEEALKLTFPAVMTALHGSGDRFSKFLETLANCAIGVFIGPEGGWSDRELAGFEKHHIPLLSLGHQTLRAETAAVAVSTLLLL